MTLPLSRRQFFGQTPVGTLAALAATEPPPRAWIIMQADWEFNDQYSYADGEIVGTTLFYDRSAAETECWRLNDEFYARETPDEFQLDWTYYFPDDLPAGKSEDEITWDDVKAAGYWKDPFSIRELTVPGAHVHQ